MLSSLTPVSILYVSCSEIFAVLWPRHIWLALKLRSCMSRRCRFPHVNVCPTDVFCYRAIPVCFHFTVTIVVYCTFRQLVSSWRFCCFNTVHDFPVLWLLFNSLRISHLHVCVSGTHAVLLARSRVLYPAAIAVNCRPMFCYLNLSVIPAVRVVALPVNSSISHLLYPNSHPFCVSYPRSDLYDDAVCYCPDIRIRLFPLFDICSQLASMSCYRHHRTFPASDMTD